MHGVDYFKVVDSMSASSKSVLGFWSSGKLPAVFCVPRRFEGMRCLHLEELVGRSSRICQLLMMKAECFFR